MTMTTFYFQVEMTKPSGRYWTIGLNLDAASYNEALRIFRAWAFGVEAMSPLTPHLRNLSDRPTRDRSYFNMDSPKSVLGEMTAFTREEGGHDLDEPLDDPVDELDDGCPF